MKVVIQKVSTLPRTEVLGLGFFKEQKLTAHPWWRQLPPEIQRALTTWHQKKENRLDWPGVKIFHFTDQKLPTIVMMGLGQRDKWSARRDRIISRRLVRLAYEHRWSKIMVAVQRLSADSAQLMTENFVMAGYEFHQFRQTPPAGWPELKTVTLLTKKKATGLDQAIRRGLTVGAAVNHCRDLANTPGGIMTPKLLAAAARRVGQETKVRVKVLGRQQITKLKMGGVLGVAKGSDQEPQFIIMEYRGAAISQKPLIMVGKGVTFDSGGLNIKPGDSMNEMHMDMSGGAAVISALSAIARLRLPINVVGLVPAVENMPSGSGYRPGDLLRSMSGQFIEVGNTDAEGRVILADALTYAQQKYKPALVVDLATLTGAALVALGQQAAALFTRDEKLELAGKALGEVSGDYVWPLPLWDEYESSVKGTFGDVSNVGKSRYGGAINGAMFLYQFIKKTPWIHLDIAPTMTSVEGQFLAGGASGTGVRWLVALAQHFHRGQIEI